MLGHKKKRCQRKSRSFLQSLAAMAPLCCFLLLCLVAGTFGVATKKCPPDDPQDYMSPDSDSCAFFWKCVYGSWVKQDCPQGLSYDPGLQNCVYPEQSSCKICPVTCPAATGTCDAANAKCICKPGYTGAACESDLDECATGTDQCQQNCTNTVGSYYCDCLSGFTLAADGFSCNDIDECSSPNSNNCQDICDNTAGSYQCACSTGFVLGPDGVSCLTDPCAVINCMNGATCMINNNQGICVCPLGFTGPQCQTLDLCVPINCQNNATCSIVGDQAFCVCPAGFTGPQCENAISDSNDTCAACSLACQNGGVCSNSSGMAKCFCANGFTGEFCEQKVSRSAVCTAATCLNGGQCTEVTGVAECLCPNGFTGTRCEETVGSQDPCVTAKLQCLNGGQCSSASGVASCFCPIGFTGINCQTPVTSTKACETSGLVCKNGGLCQDSAGTASCLCQPGFKGQTCEIRDSLCSAVVCLNGGTCQESSAGELSCACPDNFGGKFCELEINCQNTVCLNGGTCGLIASTDSCGATTNSSVGCQCLNGTSGSHCQNRQDCTADGSPCLNSGTCLDTAQGFVCACSFGWSGVTCETKRTCQNSFIDCQNGGSCEDTDDGATCHCAAGYTGDNCETVDDECGGCENGGLCKISEIFPSDSNSTKSCACLTGFTGDRCQTASECTIPCSPNLGKTGDRYEVLIFPDIQSRTHVYVCREGYLQRVEACPNTSYNIYTSGCLTPEQFEAASKGAADLYYPS